MIRREPAWRLFAREFNESTFAVRGEEGDKSPNYLISPLGAKVNRLFLVGVATEIYNYGDEKEPFWKMRVVDVNGVFFVYGGKFNPDALKVIPKLAEPSFVAIVGKARSFTPEGTDTPYVSLMIETIKEVDLYQRKLWVLNCVQHLKRRIDDYEYIKSQFEEPTKKDIMSLGFSEHEADGFALAMKVYPDDHLDRYRELARNALKSLLPQYESYFGEPEMGREELKLAFRWSLQQVFGEPEMRREEEAFLSGEEEEEGEEDLSDAVCQLVREASSEEGISWEELVALAQKKHNIDKDRLEEIVNNLLDDGILFEPKLGRLKLV